MRELAAKLMQQPSMTARPSSAVLGSTSVDIAHVLADLHRPQTRIGLWPILSPKPEVSMGLAAVLGLLLEQWQSVGVYRLFAKLDGEANLYTWTEECSQFTVDEWQLETLDENVALWGSLETDNRTWVLTLEAENDWLDPNENTGPFIYRAETLQRLTNVLPQVAKDILDKIGVRVSQSAPPAYSSITAGENRNLETLLAQLFYWELQLLLQLWGRTYADEAVLDSVEQLVRIGTGCGDDFAAWSVSGAISRSMLPPFKFIDELVTSVTGEVASQFAYSAHPFIRLAPTLYQLGKVEEAFALLDTAIQTHPQSPGVRLALADLYMRKGDVNQALDAFQQAIEDNIADARLYARYGDLLVIMDREAQPVEEFILLDSDETVEDWVIREAIEAYENSLQTGPEDWETLYRQVTLLSRIDEQRFWSGFARLVMVDKTGEAVAITLDAIQHFEDLTPAIPAIQQAIQNQPGRYDLFLNLATVALLAEETELARSSLETARALTQDLAALAEIDRLALSAEAPDFEVRLGEITDKISAGSNLSILDVEFLEEVLEKAPRFSEAYLLLAKAYQSWGEADAALETLLDAQKNVPRDPDIVEMLARTLWEMSEGSLAFDYLNRGLISNPQHVPLLAFAGRCLFENGQNDAAKAFLLRAEAIAPRHPALNEARAFIARMQSSQ